MNKIRASEFYYRLGLSTVKIKHANEFFCHIKSSKKIPTLSRIWVALLPFHRIFWKKTNNKVPKAKPWIDRKRVKTFIFLNKSGHMGSKGNFKETIAQMWAIG